jgi:hypothetical protein
MAYTAYKVLKKGYLAAIACIVFGLFDPITLYQGFYLSVFFAGIFCGEYYQAIKKHDTIVLLISALVFGICLVFWKGTDYFAVLNLFSWKTFEFTFASLPTALFRLLTGVSASVFFLAFFGKVFDKVNRENKFFKALGNCGQWTLALYIMHGVVMSFMPTTMDFSNVNPWISGLLIAPAMAAVLQVVCLLIIKLIQKSKYLNLVFFGNLR